MTEPPETAGKTFHMVMSVDADRFGDGYIRKHILPGIRVEGRILTAADFRSMCREARTKGLEVFPSCDNHDERGYCRGCTPEEPVDQSIASSPSTPAKARAARSVPLDEEDIPRAPPPTPDEADDAARFVAEARRRYKWTDDECEYLRGCIGITRAKAHAEALRRKSGE